MGITLGGLDGPHAWFTTIHVTKRSISYFGTYSAVISCLKVSVTDRLSLRITRMVSLLDAFGLENTMRYLAYVYHDSPAREDRSACDIGYMPCTHG